MPALGGRRIRRTMQVSGGTRWSEILQFGRHPFPPGLPLTSWRLILLVLVVMGARVAPQGALCGLTFPRFEGNSVDCSSVLVLAIDFWLLVVWSVLQLRL